MTDPGQEDLLGYLLGALDSDELRQVEDALEQNPLLRQKLDELTEELAAIDAMDEPEIPPTGLARRTCEVVANSSNELLRQADTSNSDANYSDEACFEESQPLAGAFGSVIEARRVSRAQSNSRPANRKSNQKRSKFAATKMKEAVNPPGSSWSASELTIAASACLILGLMFFPAIANSRHQARVTACQNNLRQIGKALVTYSDHCGGYLPRVSLTGNLAVAGAYAPQLNDAGLLNDVSVLLCPSSDLADERKDFDLPTAPEIEELRGPDARYWQYRMGGSYAYSMGYISNGKYQPHRFRGRANIVILADAPNLSDAGRRSRNHGGHGQNVVCEDLSIRYLKDCTLCGCDSASSSDQFFVNRNGVVAAGLDPDDSVVGPSEACPFVPYLEVPSR